MPVAQIIDAPTLRQILLYTYAHHVKNREMYAKRDILVSKIKVIQKSIYVHDRLDQFDEKLVINSYSRPQYYPYTKLKGGNKKNQKTSNTIEHQYTINLQLAKDGNGNYSLDSNARWRIGSFKKWKDKTDVPQYLVKTVYRETMERLKKKWKDDKVGLKKEVERIRKNGKYMDVGDYNSRVLGINGDFYFRDSPLMFAYNCLYGPLWHKEFPVRGRDKELNFPYTDKHFFGLLWHLLKKGFIKKK